MNSIERYFTVTRCSFHQRLLIAIVLALLSPSCGRAAHAIDADVLLAGGTLIDGSGSPGIIGDVAIRDEKIVAVGQFEVGKVGRRIPCDSLIVAPGFIDLHNHSDAEISTTKVGTGEPLKIRKILDPRLRAATCYLTQGCTTVVTGNCGGGAVDVEEFYNALESNPPGVNLAHLVPMGALRTRVMGQVRRAPRSAEMEMMCELMRKGMDAGAWGMSTGLQYVPGSYADRSEIVQLAAIVGERGGFYASHIRDQGDQLLESVQETIDIGQRANIPVHISHFKASKKRNWGKVRAAAKVVERAQAAGQRVTADQYPYVASSTTIAAMLLPDVEREGGATATRKRLRDPQQRKKLRPIVKAALEMREKILIARCTSHPEWVGKTIRQVAAEAGRDPVDVAFDVMLSRDERGVSFSMDERDVRFIMSLPWVATASDGSTKIDDGTRPHPRSYGTFPRRIGHYALQEQVIRVEQAIRSASGLPADILGLKDRGYLRSGYAADIVVFDPKTFRDQATFQSPFEVSTGVRWLFVNGQTAIDDGELTILDAGQALRKQR